MPTIRQLRFGSWTPLIRSGGQNPVRTSVELDLSVRGLHTKAQAKARLLCDASALAEQIVRWANAAVADGHLTVTFGYAIGRLDEREYRKAAELEVVRLARFLGLGENCWDASI